MTSIICAHCVNAALNDAERATDAVTYDSEEAEIADFNRTAARLISDIPVADRLYQASEKSAFGNGEQILVCLDHLIELLNY